MKLTVFSLFITLLIPSAFAQEEVTLHPDQYTLLNSHDTQLQKNKKLVFDFWTKVFQGKQLELASEYLATHYIQHNPNVPSGRDGFVNFFSRFKDRKGPTDHIENLVMITAENDIVTLAFRVERKHPKKEGETFTTTWFDMFRIENGLIVEHWDPAEIW